MSRFKEGDYVVCIACKHGGSKVPIVFGQKYKVTDVFGNMVKLHNVQHLWSEIRFELAPQVNSTPTGTSEADNATYDFVDKAIARNQTNKADAGKTNPLLLHEDMNTALRLVNRVLDYGAQKYERGGWKKVHGDRYKEALIRHLRDILAGEDFDNESGLLHLAHLACNALFLLEFKAETMLNAGWTTKQLFTYQEPPQDHKNG